MSFEFFKRVTLSQFSPQRIPNLWPSSSKTPITVSVSCTMDVTSQWVWWAESVSMGKHRRWADNHLPSTKVPGQLGTGTPGWQSWTILSAALATSGVVASLAWYDHSTTHWLQVMQRRSGPIVGDISARQLHHTVVNWLAMLQMRQLNDMATMNMSR